jgi:hypothetical protein
MSITGNLKTMELSELLQWVSQGKKNGTLVLDNSKVKKQIYFLHGKIVASGSTDPSEYLGHFLVSHGYIREEELAKAMETQAATRMMLGKILVTIGCISEADLKRLLVLKTEESIYDTFSWKEADFRFIDGETIERGMIPLALDVEAVILNGMKRLDDWQRIRKIIPSSDAIPVAIGFTDAEGIDEADHRILTLVNDDRTIRELCLETHSSEFHVCEVLFRQISRGKLKIVTPRGNSKPAPCPAPVVVSASQAIPAVGAKTLLDLARSHLEQSEFERALRHLRAARNLEPNNVEVQAQVKKAQELIQNRTEAIGLRPECVPRLARTLEQLTALRLSPEEGFVLSRINGSYDLRSLIKISPMDPMDAQLVFFRLLQGGHIAV